MDSRFGRRWSRRAHRLEAVLSEGERKVIALADFLAEASLRVGSAPVIFDGPMNSLDYRRLREVVARIEKLAHSHQVVVFTHNIWFAAEWLARFEKRKGQCTYYDIEEADGRKGIGTAGSSPRTDSLGNAATKIIALLRDASSAPGESREALIEKAHEYIRNWSEIFVEQEVLASVTERYTSHVGMSKPRNIHVEKLGATIDAVLPIFERACRNMGGHSQPLETLNVRASLEDAQRDWAELQKVRAAYKATA